MNMLKRDEQGRKGRSVEYIENCGTRKLFEFPAIGILNFQLSAKSYDSAEKISSNSKVSNFCGMLGESARLMKDTALGLKRQKH